MIIRKCDTCQKTFEESDRYIRLSAGWKDTKEICSECSKGIFTKKAWKELVEPGIYGESDLVKKINARFKTIKERR